MPEIRNPRQEQFARARANGARLDDAWDDVGYSPARGAARRLALQPEIAARAAEVRLARLELGASRLPALIADLMRLAAAAEALGGADGLRQARLALREAGRLRARHDAERKRDRDALIAAVETAPEA